MDMSKTDDAKLSLAQTREKIARLRTEFAGLIEAINGALDQRSTELAALATFVRACNEAEPAKAPVKN
jgi:hypothetical protein